MDRLMSNLGLVNNQQKAAIGMGVLLTAGMLYAVLFRKRRRDSDEYGNLYRDYSTVASSARSTPRAPSQSTSQQTFGSQSYSSTPSYSFKDPRYDSRYPVSGRLSPYNTSLKPTTKPNISQKARKRRKKKTSSTKRKKQRSHSGSPNRKQKST